MKTVILAGGYGTRISEESYLRPKPMIEIGEKPILWHIMKEYSYCGHHDFIICAGYKQHIIKEWFANYFLHNSDITFDFTSGKNDVIIHDQYCEPWKVSVIDTGLDTTTGGRVKKIQKYIGNEPFMLTYGDGVCAVDINEVIDFHKKSGKLATITSVRYSQSKGVMDIADDGMVNSFREKSDDDASRINGGYMVLEPEIFDYLSYDDSFEAGPMKKLISEGQLNAFRYDGFWQCMDTKREKDLLEELIASKKAPWMKWSK